MIPEQFLKFKYPVILVNNRDDGRIISNSPMGIIEGIEFHYGKVQDIQLFDDYDDDSKAILVTTGDEYFTTEEFIWIEENFKIW